MIWPHDVLRATRRYALLPLYYAMPLLLPLTAAMLVAVFAFSRLL